MNKLIQNILLVDDDVFMLKLLEHMLAMLGYKNIYSFDNGKAALAAIDMNEHMPDVILLDINMPGMDGVEFVRHLAERRYLGSLILVSGEDERMLMSTEKLAHTHKLFLMGAILKPPMVAILEALLEKYTPHVIPKLSLAGKIYQAGEVRDAIVNGELINYYQPKVAVATGEVIGVETLVRWQHSEDGMVFPDSFITVAEQHGLIGALTRHVFKQALLQRKVWQSSGLDLQVAINVSMDDITNLDFADYVYEETIAAGVSPDSVVLEVTESRLMKRLAISLDVLTRLRLKRFKLSIDDFGTGNSSLAQLRDLPFDELKIDQGFTRNAWQDQRLRTIFNNSLNLAIELDMEVVAEGVENINDWIFLRSTGCHVAQGYFIARPMAADALPDWIAQWQERMISESWAK